jgi:hypothetical protein
MFRMCTIDLAVSLLAFTPHALKLLWADHYLLLSIDCRFICSGGLSGQPAIRFPPPIRLSKALSCKRSPENG